MNLALHGFLLQVFVSILDFQHGSVLCSAGEPGYLDFDNLPETNFSCQGKVIGGYYADVEAGCQMFHVCTIGQKDEIMDIKFLCLNGTVFDQETRVCERVDEVDCSKSERFYNLNLELYGNNAVTLSLHETSEHVDIPLDSLDDHQQRTTSARPVTTTSTSTTTSKPSKLATTSSSSSFSHPTGYPQHYQPQPPFPQVHTSQSKSLFDDKNGGYHHQYIFHNGERNNNQATSYQLFSNQGVSSTTIQAPQVHQIRFSSTVSPQIIHNEPSTVAPLFHATSSTIQTLLNSNANSPALINPIFHNHGIASTTEQFSIHSSNPRDTSEYRDNGEQGIRPLEAVQSTNKGKSKSYASDNLLHCPQVSKLTISPVPSPPEVSRIVQTKTSQSSQQQRIPGNFLPTPPTVETTIRSFYPTPRTSKPTQSNDQVTQHIHVLPPVQIPQLKPQQITINLPPPDIQRIVQNPPPLLSSQSRVIVTAKASVSDESGRSLNTTQLVTLPLPTIPASYDDYKEGDETFDPFYRDVPKIRNNRRNAKEANGTKSQRSKRSLEERRSPMETFVYGVDPGKGETSRITEDKRKREEKKVDDDAKTLKQSLLKFRDILFSGEINDDSIRDMLRASESRMRKKFGKIQEKVGDLSWEDLEARASKHLETTYEDSEEESEDAEKSEKDESLDESNMEEHSAEGHADDEEKENDEVVEVEEKEEVDDADSEDKMEDLEKNEDYLDKKEDPDAVSDVEDKHLDEKKNEEHPEDERVLDIVILDTEEYQKLKSTGKPSDDSNESKANAFTEPPIISTSEESKPEETPVASEDDNLDKVSEDVETAKNIEASTESINLSSTVAIEEEILKKEEPKEMKTTTRRKSSRIRQPKGRISAKKKQPKENVEVEKEETKEQKISTNDSHIQRITEQIFDEPESQTSKEVDTRAVDEKSNYKSLKEGKDEDAGKNILRGETNEFSPAERHPNNLEKQEKSSEKIYSLENTESLETPAEEEESEKSGEKMESMEEDGHSVEVTEENVSSEEKKYYKEEASIEEIVDDESSTIASQEFKDESEETLEKESLHKMKSSRRGKSMKFEDSSKESLSHREDKSLKFKSEEETESKEHSTIRSIEEIASEEVSSEYHDSTETSMENMREISDEDDYEDPGSQEDTTMPIENNDSAESSASREKTLEEIPEDESTDDEDSTEGVLKFTDELPKEKHEETTETKKSTESVENIAQDYVDDNYEPENYKESEPTDTNNLSDEKQKEALDKEKKLADGAAVTAMPENVDENVEIKDENVDEKIEMKVENADEKVETKAEEVEEDKEDKEEEPSTTMPTTSTTTTTAPTTTTTMRPTPPKLFKPIAVRKIYNYIPPTTSPNPVIIKPRLSLLNPKPAKPHKSYNELAPKPVIRKFPLLSRKTTTTMSTTTMDDEVMETTTEAMIVTTEVGRSEENILEGKLETKEEPVTTRLLENSNKNKNDQLPSPSEHTSPSNLRKEENSKQDPQNFTPYPITKLTTLASIVEKALEKAESTTKEPEYSTGKSFTFMDLDVISTTVTSAYDISTKANFGESSGNKITEEESTTIEEEQTTVIPLESTTILETTSRLNVERPEAEKSTESTTQRTLNRKSSSWKKQGSFNCLEKEMYRFYGDTRDCRLFHYCSPGFTSRQVLDFRFVCEEGTAFDEESQSCQHDVRNRICPDKQW